MAVFLESFFKYYEQLIQKFVAFLNVLFSPNAACFKEVCMLHVGGTVGKGILSIFFNWDSLHTVLNFEYIVRSYKKKKKRKMKSIWEN